MTPSGIEPATFRFVAQHLNHCAIAFPVCMFVHVHLCVFVRMRMCLWGGVFFFFDPQLKWFVQNVILVN